MADFAVRNGLDAADMAELFAWSEEEFNRRLEGSAIRRIGHERWLRNLAVGLGNAPTTPAGCRRIAGAARSSSSVEACWALTTSVQHGRSPALTGKGEG